MAACMAIFGLVAFGQLAVAAPSAKRGAVLAVNDPNGVGAARDGKLSLSEAIRLANGTLDRRALDPRELRRVKGQPGRAVADTIRLEVAAITLPSQPDAAPSPALRQGLSSALPAMIRNDGDAIDGNGAVVANGPRNGPISGVGLRIASSRVTVRNLVLRRFFEMIRVNAPDASGLRGVTISRSRFEDGGGIYVDAIALDGSRTSVSGITVDRNVLLGPEVFGRARPGAPIVGGFNIPFSVIADDENDERWSPLSSGTARLADIRITNNYARGFPTGGSAMAVSSQRPEEGGEAVLERLLVQGNDIEITGVDPGFMVWGAVTQLGTVSMARVRDVRVLGNRFAGGTLPFYAAAGEIVFGAGAIRNVTWDGLELSGNRFIGLGSCGIGVMLTGAFQELNTGQVMDNRFAHVVVRDNSIENCGTGVVVAAATFLLGTGSTSGVQMSSVEIAENTVRGAVTGILAAGALVAPSPLAPASGLPGAVASSNVLHGVRVHHNSMQASQLGIGLYGGRVQSTSASIAAANSLEKASAYANNFVGPTGGAMKCDARADWTDSPAGAAVGNVITDVSCRTD